MDLLLELFGITTLLTLSHACRFYATSDPGWMQLGKNALQAVRLAMQTHKRKKASPQSAQFVKSQAPLFPRRSAAASIKDAIMGPSSSPASAQQRQEQERRRSLQEQQRQLDDTSLVGGLVSGLMGRGFRGVFGMLAEQASNNGMQTAAKVLYQSRAT